VGDRFVSFVQQGAVKAEFGTAGRGDRHCAGCPGEYVHSRSHGV